MSVWLCDSVSSVSRGSLVPLQTEARRRQLYLSVLDSLEVHLPRGRESGIDDDSWAQSLGSLPGMTGKQCDVKGRFFCILWIAGISLLSCQ